MAIITYPLLTVVDDAGDVVSEATVTVSSVKSPLDETILSNTVTLRQSGPNVAADYDVQANGEAWVTLSIVKDNTVITGWNASPSFYIAEDSGWLKVLGTAAADDTIHVLAVRPSGATHYRVEYLSDSSRQWWNGTALVGTEPAATTLPSDRADGLLAFDVAGLPAGEYAVAFYNGSSGTAVGVPLGATVGGGAAAMTLDATQLAAIASAVLTGTFEGSLKVSDILRLLAAVLAGNLGISGTQRTFSSPLNVSKVRIDADIDGSGNRTLSSFDVS